MAEKTEIKPDHFCIRCGMNLGAASQYVCDTCTSTATDRFIAYNRLYCRGIVPLIPPLKHYCRDCGILLGETRKLKCDACITRSENIATQLRRERQKISSWNYRMRQAAHKKRAKYTKMPLVPPEPPEIPAGLCLVYESEEEESFEVIADTVIPLAIIQKIKQYRFKNKEIDYEMDEI